jgi:predicted GIY-YIG superfamily endonuclease
VERKRFIEVKGRAESGAIVLTGPEVDKLRQLGERAWLYIVTFCKGDLPAPRRDTFFIYVLKCSDGSFYIGQTDDIPRRLLEHRAGKVAWTKARQPVEIIHWETFNSREDAVKREHDLKTGFGRQWLKREYEEGRLAARQAGRPRLRIIQDPISKLSPEMLYRQIQYLVEEGDWAQQGEEVSVEARSDED